MNQSKRLDSQSWAPSLFVLGLCIWSARNLSDIWQSDVYARGSVWIFLIWLIPLIAVLTRQIRTGRWEPDFILLILSLLSCLIGIFGSLNIARHVALGLAVGGQVSGGFWKWLWLAGMLSWLPATGWLAREIPGNGWPLRSGLLVVSLAFSYKWWKGGLK
ncbi:MAG: hypothetical protein AAFX93_01400 [Verrucomicrobiota bacterium]